MATVPVNPPQIPEVLVVKRAQNCEVVAALDRLRSIDREVIQLRLWEEASFDDIAVLLGCSRHAAEQRYAKALRRLRSVCNQAGHEWTSGTQQTLQTQERTREA
jgi:DNA-directed RNA polymerase specialized sigma24 family protein